MTFHVRARRVRLVQLRVLGKYVQSHSTYSPSTPSFIPRTRRVRSISFGVLAESAQLCVPDVYGGITKRSIPIPHSLFSLLPSPFSSLSSPFSSLSSPFSSLSSPFSSLSSTFSKLSSPFSSLSSPFSSLSSPFFSLSSLLSSTVQSVLLFCPVRSHHCPVRSPHCPVRSPHWPAVLLAVILLLFTAWIKQIGLVVLAEQRGRDGCTGPD